MAPRLGARVNAVNEDWVGLGLHCWLLAPMGVWKLLGADGRLEEIGADRAGGRHEIRSFFACGPPGRSYRQKTNLNQTTGDPWVDDLWVWVDC